MNSDESGSLQRLSASRPAFRDLRMRLVATALEWQKNFGVAPAITSAISEYDAAMVLGMSCCDYCADCAGRTAVKRGFDFVFRGMRYQVKASRPSGRPRSEVTLVPRASNYQWDRLVWILYDKGFELCEAWEWEMTDYRMILEPQKRLSPASMRAGHRLH